LNAGQKAWCESRLQYERTYELAPQAGLPPEFVLISAALLPQTFLNVPFTTALLTHGTGFLFLLWYIMPRTMFDRKIEAAAS